MERVNKIEPLSVFPFFGGKARLASLTADLLDYSSTSTYVEPFGGGARTLLNKPRHRSEIYNDGSTGLCTFMRTMADRDSAAELIEKLYETEYSKECFDEAHSRCIEVDKTWERREVDELGRVQPSHREQYEDWKQKTVALVGRFNADNDKDLQRIQAKIERIDTEEAREAWKQFVRLNSVKYGEIKQQYKPPRFSDLQVAMDVFVTYTQSRDGMGNHFSADKFKTQDEYYKRIDRLHKAAERLEGVHVWNADAELFFIEQADLFTRPDVMAYCDPPYLADTDKGEAKNLGTVYREQMAAERHELFLTLATKAQCKMLISNYDNELYNTYLQDWTRIDVPVTTSVGGKKDNKRVEVLWYNC